MPKQSESTILKKCMMKASELGMRVFRNNVGLARQPNGQVIKYGLANGSSDLIGWMPITITADMVGKKVAQFVAIETKSSRGRATDAQINFLKQVDEAGGVAILAKSEKDVEQIIKEK